MILGNSEEQIVKKAVSCQSEIADGVVQYNYETGELCVASFTTGTVENPAIPVIEVFRLPQGERGEIDYDCNECPFRCESARYDGWEKLYPATSEECCMNAYIDNDFDDDFDDNYRESVESQIRDVLSDYIGDTLQKLDEIRIAISDIVAPYDYINVRQDNWYMNIMDSYVDNAMENGLNITETDAIGYLDAEVQYIGSVRFDENASETLQRVGCLVEDGKLDEALKLLH